VEYSTRVNERMVFFYKKVMKDEDEVTFRVGKKKKHTYMQPYVSIEGKERKEGRKETTVIGVHNKLMPYLH